MNRTRWSLLFIAALFFAHPAVELRAQLALHIDSFTGDVQLVNDPLSSTGSVTFDAYSIQSPGGALFPSGWFSLSNQGYPDWLRAGTPTEHLLAEVQISGSTTFPVGHSLSIGSVYNGFTGIQDLVFEYAVPGGAIVNGPVFYAGSPPPLGLVGDYNFDGIVSHADYSVLGDTYGSTENLAADGNGDGAVSLVDYFVYRDHYGNVAATGSVPSELPLAVVPTTTVEGHTRWTITVQGVPNSLAGHLNLVSSQSNFLSATGGSSMLDEGSPPAGVPGRTLSGAIAEGIFFESRQAFAALGSTLGAPSPGQNREFVSLVTEGDQFTTLSLSGEFGYGGVTYFINQSYSFGPGSSPAEPLLPDATAPGEFIFQNAPSGAWVDPPLVDSFEYVMDSASLFTSILDFPPGFVDPFEVIVDGVSLGSFGPGQSVDFIALLGQGVERFIVSGIAPLVDAADPIAFPLKLEFSTPTASFRMFAVPEPGTLVLTAVCCGLLCLRGRRLTAL